MYRTLVMIDLFQQTKKAPQNLGGISKTKLDYKRVIVSTAVRVVPSPTAVMVAVRQQRSQLKDNKHKKSPPESGGHLKNQISTITVSS